MNGSKTSFDILDPAVDVKKSYFLEASAGTGKTYTIENCVIRLIQEGIPLHQILVVTFTRAATLELKMRIRRNLEEKGMKKELANFEEAPIFTMHSFCFQTLKEHALEAGFPLSPGEENVPQKVLNRIFSDFLRTELSSEEIHPRQLEKVLSGARHELNRLLHEITLPRKGESKSYGELREELKSAILATQWAKETLFDQLLEGASSFKLMMNRQKQLKPEVVEGLKRFCSLYEEIHEDIFDLPLQRMVPENLLAKAKYPPILELLHQRVIPVLAKLSSREHTLDRLRLLFNNFLERVSENADYIFYDSLLKKMHAAVKNPLFSAKVRSDYQAALIDEFQDTDALQWDIFSELFLNHIPLYLVGDPKQSIYRFRGADLYTYMRAKQQMGEAAQTTLTRNFRSDPLLIEGLNSLFAQTPELITLPKIGGALPIPEIMAANPPTQEGRVVFCHAAQESDYFNFIINEVERLHREKQLPYSAFAVLVKDRYQASRFCRKCPLPYVTRKSSSLLDSAAFPLLYDVLKAACDPRNRQSLHKVLGGPLFGLPLNELVEKSGQYVPLFYALHQTLRERGILKFFQQLKEAATFPETALYLDMLQLVELMAERTHHTEEYLPLLQKLKAEGEESEILKSRIKVDGDALQVMTMHVSKGLEFDTVFPAGLMANADMEEEEDRSEKMRHLYVAITRAKKRVYLPISGSEKSPMHYFLKEVLKDRTLEGFIRDKECFSTVYCPQLSSLPVKKEFAYVSEETRLPRLNFAPQNIYSYTTLSHEKSPFFKNLTAVQKIPLGAETGIILHTLFEHLHFKISESELAAFVTSQLLGTPLQPYQEAVLEIVSAALNYSFESPACRFKLSDLDPLKIKREMEFLYLSEEPVGFIKGFIDLFFEYEGKFFLLDWKSNALEKYDTESLKKEIESYKYDLQAKLYLEAAKRYLRIFGRDNDLEGIFYLFLRGLKGHEKEGLYFFPS